MEDIAINVLGALCFGSGFLFWPICALAWRAKRRTTVLRWVFVGQVVCTLVLGGFALLSGVKVDPGDAWLILLEFLNVFFTALAMIAAIVDYTVVRVPPNVASLKARDP